MFPMDTVLPQYFQAYAQYVCPLRPQTCRFGMKIVAPPLEIQRKRLDFLETLPGGLRGLALELLDEGRVDDVDFLQSHADDYQRFSELFRSVPDSPDRTTSITEL